MHYGISLVYSIKLFSNKFIFQIDEFNYDNPNANILFKVIFLDLTHYEEEEAVKWIRENRMYTILSEKIDNAYIDDNGVYVNSQSTERMYHVDIDKKT